MALPCRCPRDEPETRICSLLFFEGKSQILWHSMPVNSMSLSSCGQQSDGDYMDRIRRPGRPGLRRGRAGGPLPVGKCSSCDRRSDSRQFHVHLHSHCHWHTGDGPTGSLSHKPASEPSDTVTRDAQATSKQPQAESLRLRVVITAKLPLAAECLARDSDTGTNLKLRVTALRCRRATAAAAGRIADLKSAARRPGPAVAAKSHFKQARVLSHLCPGPPRPRAEGPFPPRLRLPSFLRPSSVVPASMLSSPFWVFSSESPPGQDCSCAVIANTRPPVTILHSMYLVKSLSVRL
jgi:hypothetical protein